MGESMLTTIKALENAEKPSGTETPTVYCFMRGDGIVLKFFANKTNLKSVVAPQFWKILTANASKLKNYVRLGDSDSCFDLKVKIESIPHCNAFEAVLPSLRLKSYADRGLYDELLLEQQVDNKMIPLRLTTIKKGSYVFYSLL